MKKKTKNILIWTAVGVLIALNALGLYLLLRAPKATALRLSETTLTLKMDEGRVITHAIEPYGARNKTLHYSVSWSSEIIAWVDEKDEMVVAVSPGVTRITGEIDGRTASIDVTVLEETILAGTWTAPGGTVLTLDNALSGSLDGTPVTWYRGAFTDGENANPYRYVKLTGAIGETMLTLYYDRLDDTLQLRGLDADATDGVLFTRG